MSNSQWESVVASDLRYIRNRVESVNSWRLIQVLLLLWIGIGVWSR